MLWLDTKYVSLLSFRLRNFKRKGNDQWNFSCPYCGDSKKEKSKARGYIFQKNGKLRFFCHNCSIPNIDIPKLIKHLDPSMYDEYVKEKPAPTKHVRFNVWDRVQMFYSHLHTLTLKRRKYTGYVKLKTF